MAWFITTHTHMHTHIQIAPRTQGDLATEIIQIRRFNLSFPCSDSSVCFDLLDLNTTHVLFAAELKMLTELLFN